MTSPRFLVKIFCSTSWPLHVAYLYGQGSSTRHDEELAGGPKTQGSMRNALFVGVCERVLRYSMHSLIFYSHVKRAHVKDTIFLVDICTSGRRGILGLFPVLVAVGSIDRGMEQTAYYPRQHQQQLLVLLLCDLLMCITYSECK